MSISKQEFGKFIRERRLKITPPLSLRGFAAKVKVSPTYICKIEQGDFDPPSVDTIVRMAKQLKLDEDELLAMAGKVSTDVVNIIINKPVQAAQFLRTTQNLTEEGWKILINQAKEISKEID